MLAGLDLVFRQISKFLKEILGLLNKKIQKNFLAQEKPIRTSDKGQKKILETFDILSKKIRSNARLNVERIIFKWLKLLTTNVYFSLVTRSLCENLQK